VPSSEDLLFPYEADIKPIDLHLYPGASKYLNQFKEKLSGRMLDGKNVTQWNKEWFELWRAREPEFFERNKIVCPRIAEKNRFAYDDTGAYLSDSVVAIIPKKINIYFLLGLLNSKLLEAYITAISPYVQGKYYNYSKSYIEKLPIKIPANKNEEVSAEKIQEKVKEILRLKKKDKNTDTNSIEKEIDDLVYDLYGLTLEERKVIVI
jgi:site-specific DNA-methyltransferase (adenine-specific)